MCTSTFGKHAKHSQTINSQQSSWSTKQLCFWNSALATTQSAGLPLEQLGELYPKSTVLAKEREKPFPHFSNHFNNYLKKTNTRPNTKQWRELDYADANFKYESVTLVVTINSFSQYSKGQDQGRDRIKKVKIKFKYTSSSRVFVSKFL